MKIKKSLIFVFYSILFLSGIKALSHGFPDIERFFAEWWDERLTLTYIMKFGTLNFSPSMIMHPPLYHYLTFIPIAIFFMVGKFIGIFHDRIDFIKFYFNNTHYFFLIGRIVSYLFYWLTAIFIFRISRLFYNKTVSHITVIGYLLIPRLIFDYSTTRPETVLFFATSIFTYLILRFYIEPKQTRYFYWSAIFLGISTAAKYNAIFLGVIFLPLFFSNKMLSARNFLKVSILIFIGFFVTNPFFIIEFNKFFHNLLIYNIENKYYWYAPSVFGYTHIRDLASLIYLNPLGIFIFFVGGFVLFRKNRFLFFTLFLPILVFEIYFSIFLRQQSPLRYLNPLMPIAALFFATGVNWVFNKKRILIILVCSFFAVEIYNYFDIWFTLSFKRPFTQEARGYIEKHIPEFSNICIASNTYMPQLNTTRESYWHLIRTAPSLEEMKGIKKKLDYIKMDDESRYDNSFREIRVESMMKKPQYNIVRWYRGIKAEEEANRFFKDKGIRYIICYGSFMIGNKNLSDFKNISLVKEFRPGNARVYGRDSLYLYRININ